MFKSGIRKWGLVMMFMIIDIFVFSSNTATASQWVKTYGGGSWDYANSIQQTSDGGYIMAGGTGSFRAAWVLKLDGNGDVQWQKAYGGGYYVNSIQQASDGGYIVAGEDRTSFGECGYQAWVLKLDGNGNVQWTKTYGGGEPNSIQQVSDGRYIVAGRTSAFGAGSDDAWVLKLDGNGSVQWQKTYGRAGFDTANSILQTSDGGYIVAGSTQSPDPGYHVAAWVLKLDGNGSVQWQKTYGDTETEDDVASSIQQTSDGGYIVAGSFVAGSWDPWVLKLDGNGNVQWQKVYYGGIGEDHAYSIQQTSDGGYIVAGITTSFGAGWIDAWVLKLDGNGNVQWQKTYGDTNGDDALSVVQASDGGYIVTGKIFSGSYAAWVLKLDGNGNINDCSIVKTSNAQVSDTYATVQDTNVIGADSYASPQTTTDSVWNTNATVTEVCYNGPDISVSPTSLNFGSVNIGSSSAPQTFTISNTGTAALHISGMTLSDTTNYSLNVNGGSSPCGSTTPTVVPNSSCTFTVTFNPSSIGQKNANLTISSDDPDTQTLNVMLSGDGQMPPCFNNLDCGLGFYCKKPEGSCNSAGVCTVRPDICPTLFMPVCGCNGVTYPNNCEAALAGVSIAYQGECILPPTIGYSPTSFSFSATQGGSNPPSQTLSITNAGGGTLNWSVSDNTTWLSLNPISGTGSGTVTVSVNISGLSAGTYNATITITATGATNSPVNIPVILIVNAPPAIILVVPIGGEVLPSGGTYAICWESPSNAVRFDLMYSTDNGTIWNFIKSVTGLNCTNWEIPVLTANKPKCRVKVIGYDSNGVQVGEDISDKPFTIEVLRVTSPNGGEILTSGNTYKIQWTTHKTIRPVATTELWFRTDVTTWRRIKTFTGNPGSYDVRVPYATAPKRGGVAVRLKDASGNVLGTDTSDRFFTIQP